MWIPQAFVPRSMMICMPCTDVFYTLEIQSDSTRSLSTHVANDKQGYRYIAVPPNIIQVVITRQSTTTQIDIIACSYRWGLLRFMESSRWSKVLKQPKLTLWCSTTAKHTVKFELEQTQPGNVTRWCLPVSDPLAICSSKSGLHGIWNTSGMDPLVPSAREK